MRDDSLFVDIQTAGRMLGLHRSAAYELAKRDALPGLIRLPGRRMRVSRLAIEEYARSAGQMVTHSPPEA